MVQQPAPLNYGPAVVKPKLPPLGTNKRYRVQVGAYRITRNAVEAFDRVKSLGIDPAYERHEELYRVVISGMRAEDIQSLAEKLGSVGFREVLLREE
jgi:rare lipoprotein A